MMRYIVLIIINLSVLYALCPLKPEWKADTSARVAAVAEEDYLQNIQAKLQLLKAQDEILVLKSIIAAYRHANTRQLRLSAYTASPEEGNNDEENTAIMQAPKPGWTVAVSPDLRGWLGKRVYIDGYGVRLVNDLMNPRYRKSIDILVEDVQQALEIGVREPVEVILVEPFAVDQPTSQGIALAPFCGPG